MVREDVFVFLFHLKRNTFSHSPLNMLTGFSKYSFISLGGNFLLSCFPKLKLFIINVCWIFQVFFAFIKIITGYFSFVLLFLELHHLNFEYSHSFVFIGWTQLGPDGLSFLKENISSFFLILICWYFLKKFYVCGHQGKLCRFFSCRFFVWFCDRIKLASLNVLGRVPSSVFKEFVLGYIFFLKFSINFIQSSNFLCEKILMELILAFSDFLCLSLALVICDLWSTYFSDY